MDFRAPDGSRPTLMYSGTIQQLTVPAGRTAILYTSSDADWENAAVVYIDGYQIHPLLGNYDHLMIMHLLVRDRPQAITLTGWHKEGPPDSELGWHPSQGSPSAMSAAWRDSSGADAPYNDLRIDVVLGPRVESSPQPFTADASAYRVDTAQRAVETAHLLTYFATLAEAGTSTVAVGTRRGVAIDEFSDRLIAAYLAARDEREPPDDQANLLTSALVLRAHELGEGSLRERLLQVTSKVKRLRTDVAT